MAKRARKRTPQPETCADSLRAAIEQSDLTHYRIAKNVGYTADVVDRFVAGMDSRISTVEKLAAGVGYRIVLEPLEG